MKEASCLRSLLIERAAKLITHPQLREFVYLALQYAPDYIWEINASTSGKHHSGETQTEHVLAALALAESLQPALEHHRVQPYLPPEGPSLLYAIVILHDLYKCGLPSQERRWKDGTLATDPLHPLYPPEALKHLELHDDNTGGKIPASRCVWWPRFVQGVAGHMGPWSPASVSDAGLQNLGDFTLLGFLCDYFASRKNIQIDF